MRKLSAESLKSRFAPIYRNVVGAARKFLKNRLICFYENRHSQSPADWLAYVSLRNFLLRKKPSISELRNFSTKHISLFLFGAWVGGS